MNSINNNNNNNNNEILFKKVFTNKYILNKIYSFIKQHNNIIKLNNIISKHSFSIHSLSKFKFRDQLFMCKIGYSNNSLMFIEDNSRNEEEKRLYYFYGYQENPDEFNKRSTISNDEILTSGIIPSKVTTLTISINPSQFDLNALSSNIRTLIILNYSPYLSFDISSNRAENYLLNNDIPQFIENLELNQIFSNVYNLPMGLRALSLKGRFNSYIEELPCKNLQYLELGYVYSKRIDHLLPNLKKLKTLILGSSYTQTIRVGILPESLEFISFSCQFEENSLPNSLKVLEIDSLEISVASKLPNSLKCLIFKKGSYEIFKPGDLPSSLLYLDFGRGKDFNEGFSFIPKSLTELLFGNTFNLDLNDTDYENLPSSLTNISFGKSFNQDININCLPKSIKYITFKNDYKMYKVEHLKKFGINFNKQLSNDNNESTTINNINFLNKFIDNPIIFNNYILN